MECVDINERLPKQHEEVLLYLEGVCILQGSLINKTKNPDLAEWSISYPYAEECDDMNELVTHWCILPGSPKVK